MITLAQTINKFADVTLCGFGLPVDKIENICKKHGVISDEVKMVTFVRHNLSENQLLLGDDDILDDIAINNALAKLGLTNINLDNVRLARNELFDTELCE